MKCEDVLRIRKTLGLSQSDLAMMLGVHSMSISNWETKKPPNSPLVQALLAAFSEGAKSNPDIGQQAIEIARTHGMARALYAILGQVFGTTASSQQAAEELF